MGPHGNEKRQQRATLFDVRKSNDDITETSPLFATRCRRLLSQQGGHNEASQIHHCCLVSLLCRSNSRHRNHLQDDDSKMGFSRIYRSHFHREEKGNSFELKERAVLERLCVAMNYLSLVLLGSLRHCFASIFTSPTPSTGAIGCAPLRTRNHKSLPGLLLYLMFWMMLISSPAFAQTPTPCNLESDCYPPSQDLLVQGGSVSRSIEVSSTCGTEGNTPYMGSSLQPNNTIYQCGVGEPHPKENMLDRITDNTTISEFSYENPVLRSTWQSSNTIDKAGDNPTEQYVIANFGSPFLIRYIRLIFLSPHIDDEMSTSDMRPRAMSFEKQTSDGSWIHLRYYAENCARYFPGVHEHLLDGTGPDFAGDVLVCEKRYFSGDVTTKTGWGLGRQEVKFTPARDFDQEFANSFVLQTFYTAVALRMRLIQPADYAPLSSYYAVADLEIDGQCACFGHASSCSGASPAVCSCEHNTMGATCEECLPLFNNRPWQIGANGLANACEDCGCNDHATTCVYNEAKEYGVCTDCDQFTAGDKCEFCVDFYFVNPDRDLYNATNPPPFGCTGFDGTNVISYGCGDSCIPCDCDQNGTVGSSLYNCNNFTGQCQCKLLVQNRRCDECQDGYFNLAPTNLDGCQKCDCNSQGTVNNTNLCNKTTGACICKANTVGATCKDCQPGFFDLRFNNPLGCSPCNCDPGGSTSTVCPVTTGICPCRPNIGSRTCSTPALGFFAPQLDYLTYEAEFTPSAANFELVERPGHGQLNATVTGRGFLRLQAQTVLEFDIRVPTTEPYNVIVRYESGVASWFSTTVTTRVRDPTNAGFSEYTCDGVVRNVNTQQVITENLNPAASQGGQQMGSVCLRANTNFVATISLGNPIPADSTLLLDSLVLLPILEETGVYMTATPTTQQAMSLCYAATVNVDLALRANLSCPDYGYSIMTELYNGAIRCSCDVTGSLSAVCDPRSGQCPCKPGVMLLDCSQCQVDYYGFNSGNGCTACECDALGSVTTACNDTAICQCQPNVVGTRCDTCRPGYYGLFTGDGCVPCVCNSDYALSLNCEDSGQCLCKPGIGGIQCDKCLEGFFGLSTTGCTDCGCNLDGSVPGLVCNEGTGQCVCKAQVAGSKCDQCQPGYFGLGQWVDDGCLQCFCSGHSTNCTTAEGWYFAESRNTWDLLQSSQAVLMPWTGVDENDLPIAVSDPTFFQGNTAEHVMRIINDGDNFNRVELYFLATEPYLGNKRGAYGQNLVVSLRLQIPFLLPNETATPIPSFQGDIILEGLYTSLPLVVALPHPPNSTILEYQFPLRESIWHIGTTDGPTPSYRQFLEVISALGALKIRAKFVQDRGATTDLHAAVLQFAAPEPTPGGPISNIESCTCDPGYTGQFCESCVAGYRRSGAGAFDPCVPCDCNNHASEIGCDPETGVCSCTHNTMGNQCETCMDGYYGDATMGTPLDCQPCMCPGNVVDGSPNAFASTCQVGQAGGHLCTNCTDGYVGDHCQTCMMDFYGTPEDPLNNGGRCVPCLCNGRADTCDSLTGDCFQCRNNTAGKECDICASGYFGVAATYSCTPCNCFGIGAVGDCDHQSGQCVCRPNVVGFFCTECAINTYNFASGLGCTACDCDAVGAIIPGCNRTTGQCECRERVIGRQCNLCEDTYWNVSPTGCQACDCSLEGALVEQPFGKCEVTTGQCTCALEGIIGRTCDRCAPGTLGDYTYISGVPPEEYRFVQGLDGGIYPQCELCGECFDNWAVKIDAIGVEITNAYETSLRIWNNYGNLQASDVSSTLAEVSGNLSAIDSSLIVAMDMMSDLNFLGNGFTEVQTAVGFYSEELDVMDQRILNVSNGMAENRLFVGRIQVNSTTILTPSQMLSATQSLRALQAAVYSAANTSWSNIEEQTLLIQRSNGDIDVFVTSVTTALGVLDQARQSRLAAQTIMDGQFQSQFESNSANLAAAQRTVQDWPRQVASVSGAVQAASAAASQASVTATSAARLANTLMTTMTQEVTQSEQVKADATLAQQASSGALSAVNIYGDTGNATKTRMTSALQDVVDGVRTMRAIANKQDQGSDINRNVSAIVLRPLQQMEAIAGEIANTPVSPGRVTETLAAAQRGLAIAQEAQIVTITAVGESNRTLEQVRGIQSNLDQTGTLGLQSQSVLDELQNNGSVISDITASVNLKSTLSQQLGQSTSNSINSIVLLITAVGQCLDNQVAATQEALTQAQDANTAGDVAGVQSVTVSLMEAETDELIHTQNAQRANNWTNAIEDRKATIDAGYADMLTVRADADALLADLAEINSITNLQSLQNEFASQRTEMTLMQTALANLESELDSLLAALDFLSQNPENTSCR